MVANIYPCCWIWLPVNQPTLALTKNKREAQPPFKGWKFVESIHVNGDLPRFGMFHLGHPYLQDTIAVTRLDSVLLHGLRQIK